MIIKSSQEDGVEDGTVLLLLMDQTELADVDVLVFQHVDLRVRTLIPLLLLDLRQLSLHLSLLPHPHSPLLPHPHSPLHLLLLPFLPLSSQRGASLPLFEFNYSGIGLLLFLEVGH